MHTSTECYGSVPYPEAHDNGSKKNSRNSCDACQNSETTAQDRARVCGESKMDYGYGVACVIAGINNCTEKVLGTFGCRIFEYLQLG